MKLFDQKMKKNNKKFYEISDEELIIRDRLAADRTALANERTYLSYIRTALAFAAAGFGILKLYTQTALIVFGWILISAGIIIAIIGTIRFIQFRLTIKNLGCADGMEKLLTEAEKKEKQKKE